MTDKKQKIHGADINLGLDEKLTEEQALARAKKEGIEFVDTFQVEGEKTEYETLEEAQKASKKGDNIVQIRRQK